MTAGAICSGEPADNVARPVLLCCASLLTWIAFLLVFPELDRLIARSVSVARCVGAAE